VTNPIDIQGRIRTHKTQERMDQKSESENARNRRTRGTCVFLTFFSHAVILGFRKMNIHVQ
jgi:hypothetical protein